MAYILLKCKIYNKSILVTREDVRYQYAIDNAETEYLYIMHDDIIFHDDILGVYLDAVKRNDFVVVW